MPEGLCIHCLTKICCPLYAVVGCIKVNGNTIGTFVYVSIILSWVFALQGCPLGGGPSYYYNYDIEIVSAKPL